MKYAMLFPLLALGFDLVAQPYIPLLDTAATWQDSYTSGDPGPGTIIHECYLYYLEGDTLLSDTAYKILRRNGRFHYDQIEPPYNTYTNWYAGSITAFLREDTAARKVFVRLSGLDPEQLLYDFSVGLGPYPWTYYVPISGVQVTSVDSVVLVDGPHRRITLGYSTEIIEGVGHVDGFWPRQSSAPLGPGGLVCQTIEGLQNLFGSGGACFCGTNVGLPTYTAHKLKVSPSPTAELCQVQGAPAYATLRLHNTTGSLLHTVRCNAEGTAILDMSALPDGCYALTGASDDAFFTARIIVAH